MFFRATTEETVWIISDFGAITVNLRMVMQIAVSVLSQKSYANTVLTQSLSQCNYSDEGSQQ